MFAVDDDDSDGSDGGRRYEPHTGRNGGGYTDNPTSPTTPSVRFNDTVEVMTYSAPHSMASTISSREAEFELDSDEIDEDDMPEVPTERSQRMPLLVGLIEAPSTRDDDPDHRIDLERLAEQRTSGGNLFDSIANMANSILGAGIIGLPYALSQAGFFMGIFLLVLLCVITDWTIGLIVINAKLSGTHSYIDIMDRSFGPSGRAAVSLFQFAFAFGGMSAFGIIIGDTIPHVIISLFPSLKTIPVLSLLTNREFVIVLCTACISYPLSLYRDIHKLARASGLALVGMVIIVASVVIESPAVKPELKGDPSKRFSFVGPGIFQAIGVISFAFVCHHNSLLIYGSMREPTLDRFARVTHISTAMSLVSCLILSIAGYVTFTDKTQGNILNNFSTDDTLINIARFCFGLNMFTTLPLELFVCREVVEQYFFSHERFDMTRHVFFTTSILFASMLVSLFTCDLGVMLEITGGVSATALAFIFPAIAYIKLSNGHQPWYSRSKLPAVLCAGFGVVVLMISLLLTFRKTWDGTGDARICSVG